MASRDSIWPYVSMLADSFRQKSPAGMAGVVEIGMADGTTFRPTVAREDPPWILFEIAEPDDESAREILVVREQDVRAIRFRREAAAKQPIGFHVEPFEPE